MPRCRQCGQRLVELVAIERLDQEAVHPGLEAGIAILHQRVGGEREDRRPASGLAGFELTDAFGGVDGDE